MERSCAQVRRPTCRLNSEAGAPQGCRSGNVRQLQDILFRVATLSDKAILDAFNSGEPLRCGCAPPSVRSHGALRRVFGDARSGARRW
ncbi:MAG TPA: hypothetical protein VMK12_02510 [Anaeromyxobacteraceae bacterium]|nr:hypothetical protein [Anaeromyxobacteraceae bacterium]